MVRPRFAAIVSTLALIVLGPMAPCFAPAALARATNTPPTITVPHRVNVYPRENLSFPLELTDGDDPVESLRVTIDKQYAPPGSYLEQDRQGQWVMYVVADPRLQPDDPTQSANIYWLRFTVDDGFGGTAEASTYVHFLRERGQNLPTISTPYYFKAPAGKTSDLIVSATDPDGDTGVTLAARVGEPNQGVTTSVQPTTGGAFRVSVTVPEGAKSTNVTIYLDATDSTGRQVSDYLEVEIPDPGAYEIVTLEVRWIEPQEGQSGQLNFNPPENIEAFPAPTTFTRINDTSPQSDVEAYVIYASDTPDFEPSPATLVGLADRTWLNGTVTLLLPKTKAHSPRHIRCTVRRSGAESKPSKETSTDTPRFPGTPVYKKNKLLIDVAGSNIVSGAQIEVRSSATAPGDRFPVALSKKGTKWLIKSSTLSLDGGKRLKDVIRKGQPVVLLLVNENGKISAPYVFVP